MVNSNWPLCLIICQIVNLIEETGHFNVTNTTFDFDLFSLDESTVRKLQSYLEATATWQEVEKGVWMAAAAAAAAVDSPLRLLCKETTSSYTCCICFTGLTEPSNNYHTNRNTRTNTSTHEDARPSHDAGEEPGGGGGGGVEESTGVAKLCLQSGFPLHISFFESVQSCGMHPAPPPSLILLLPLQNPILPLLLLFLPLNTHTPYSAEHSSSLPPTVSWSSFLSRHSLELCVCVVCACTCVWALLRFKRRCCLSGYWLLFVGQVWAQTTVSPPPSHAKQIQILYSNNPPSNIYEP